MVFLLFQGSIVLIISVEYTPYSLSLLFCTLLTIHAIYYIEKVNIQNYKCCHAICFLKFNCSKCEISWSTCLLNSLRVYLNFLWNPSQCHSSCILHFRLKCLWFLILFWCRGTLWKVWLDTPLFAIYYRFFSLFDVQCTQIVLGNTPFNILNIEETFYLYADVWKWSAVLWYLFGISVSFKLMFGWSLIHYHRNLHEFSRMCLI